MRCLNKARGYSCEARLLSLVKPPSWQIRPIRHRHLPSERADELRCVHVSPRLYGAGEGNSTRSLTRLLRTSFPIQASRNGLDCGLKSSAWSTQAVAGDPKRAKHIHQQPEHRISFGSLSVHWHTTPQVATDRRAAVLKGLALHRPVRPRLSPAR